MRPAADFTFDLAAEIYKKNSIAVILTGMGRDGSKGAFKIKHYGGKVISEAKETLSLIHIFNYICICSSNWYNNIWESFI